MREGVGRRRAAAAVLFVSVTLASVGASGDYAEECLSEGCSDHEVKELYDSYKEECLNEGCSKEEIIELAGGPQYVNQMLQAFRDRGWRVAESDGGASLCRGIGSMTRCLGFLMFCQDWYQCPTGTDSCEGSADCPGGNSSSAWYVCGGCFGFRW